MEQKKSIFREKAITRVTSPEQLNEYIRVATPGIWFILVAILLALVGMFAWIFFGKVDATLTTAGIAENGVLTCYVPEGNRSEVNPGDPVTVNGKTYHIEEIGASPVSITEDFPEYGLHVGSLSIGQWVYHATLKTDIPDGVYQAVITTESIRPSSFLDASQDE
ncbi:MAG: hypothetical protein IKY03_00870 [Clostridia bacterium]|nr:hypothetical protein [Clostridia bacterium]